MLKNVFACDLRYIILIINFKPRFKIFPMQPFLIFQDSLSQKSSIKLYSNAPMSIAIMAPHI